MIRDQQGNPKQERKRRQSVFTEVSKTSSELDAPRGPIRSNEMGRQKTTQSKKKPNQVDRSSTGRPTYASSIKITRNTYVRNIKPAKFINCLGNTNQFLKRHYDKEGDKNSLSKLRRMESSG